MLQRLFFMGTLNKKKKILTLTDIRLSVTHPLASTSPFLLQTIQYYGYTECDIGKSLDPTSFQ